MTQTDHEHTGVSRHLGLPRMLYAGMTLVCLCTLSCSGRDEPPAPAAVEPREGNAAATPAETAPKPLQEKDSQEVRFPTFGVTLKPPTGWVADDSLLPVGVLARWLPAGAAEEDWSQFAVDVRPIAAGQTARQAAAMFEKRGYRRTAARLGGFAAERLDAPPLKAGAEPRPRPSPLLIARRGERLWRLLFLFNDPEDAAEIDEVIASWQWIPLEPVSDHLQPGAPQPILGGVGTMQLPAIARVDASLSLQDSVAYSVYDYGAVQDAIIFACHLKPVTANANLSALAVLYAEQIEENADLGELIAFDALPSRPNVFASEVIRGEFVVDGQTVNRYSRYAVWQPHPDVVVRIQTVVNAEVFTTQDSLRSALEAVSRCLASCSPMATEPFYQPSLAPPRGEAEQDVSDGEDGN
ncbi:MAG: hypothetical protein AAGF31_00610 [Planctomycetota bacterium]